jgi:hypothetical protein
MKNFFAVKVFVFLFCAASLCTGPAFAYTEAQHKSNIKDKNYAAAFAKMEESLKKVRKELPPVLANVIEEEQAAWFAGLDDDFEGAEDNIDVKANQYVEFEGYKATKAYAAAVEDRTKEIEERYRFCWLMVNRDGLQGLYLLKTDGAVKAVKSVLEIRELPQKAEGAYEFDVRLTLEADMGEGTARSVFHNAGRFTEGRMSLFDDREGERSKQPLHVQIWLGEPYEDAMEVIVDDNFKKDPMFEERYKYFTIAGVYPVEEFRDK